MDGVGWGGVSHCYPSIHPSLTNHALLSTTCRKRAVFNTVRLVRLVAFCLGTVGGSGVIIYRGKLGKGLVEIVELHHRRRHTRS